MVDRLDAAARSANMARVRSTNTRPERTVRKLLHAAGFRFRLHRRDLPGTPDLVLPRYRIAIFVHGCFWHRHEGCKRATTPSSRTPFWEQKFARTKARDAKAISDLRSLGWAPVVLWECEIKAPGHVAQTVERIAAMGSKRVQTLKQAASAPLGTRKRDQH